VLGVGGTLEQKLMKKNLQEKFARHNKAVAFLVRVGGWYPAPKPMIRVVAKLSVLHAPPEKFDVGMEDSVPAASIFRPCAIWANNWQNI
jgi:hypothetical protein